MQIGVISPQINTLNYCVSSTETSAERNAEDSTEQARACTGQKTVNALRMSFASALFAVPSR
jgi:hypothetical protein